MVGASDGSERNLAFLLVWFGGVTSAIIDNVPYTATMVEVVGGFPGSEPAGASPLWWALALGADLGGNATVVGASANVVRHQPRPCQWLPHRLHAVLPLRHLRQRAHAAGLHGLSLAALLPIAAEVGDGVTGRTRPA